MLRFVKAYAPTITQFLKDNYCPEINSPDCGNHLDEHYPKILVRKFLRIMNYRHDYDNWHNRTNTAARPVFYDKLCLQIC